MLDPRVSSRIVETMNDTLVKGGILAFIGTRSEFGAHCLNLKETGGMDTRRCWISLPASTIEACLGLCPNTPISGRLELAFNGYPLILLGCHLRDLRTITDYVETLIDELDEHIINLAMNPPWLEEGTPPEVVLWSPVSGTDLEEALTKGIEIANQAKLVTVVS